VVHDPRARPVLAGINQDHPLEIQEFSMPFEGWFQHQRGSVDGGLLVIRIENQGVPLDGAVG
jgi:hypothetical protein